MAVNGAIADETGKDAKGQLATHSGHSYHAIYMTAFAYERAFNLN